MHWRNRHIEGIMAINGFIHVFAAAHVEVPRQAS